jgi:flavodoxin
MAETRAAVIFYSLKGNTRHLAELIAEETASDMIEVTPAPTEEGRGPLKHVWGSTQLRMPEEPSINAVEADLDIYDILFVGTPVWAGGVAPPLRTFLNEREFFRRNFAFFASYSGRTGRVFQDLRRRLAGNEVLGEIGVREPLEHRGSKLEERIRKWAREMQKKLN